MALPARQSGDSDGTSLEAACDAVYVVTPRANAESPEVAERIRHMLERGSPVRGCAVTGR